MVAPLNPTSEIRRHRYDKSDFATGYHILGLTLGRIWGDEAIIARQFQCRDHRACITVLGRGHERGRKRLGIGIDREPKEHQLHQRHTQHHRKGHTIPPHLDHFLYQKRDKPMERKEPVHCILSCAAPMSWINTSSRLVSDNSAWLPV